MAPSRRYLYLNLQVQEDEAVTVAIYPGSFDPMTKGHLDIVERAAALFERLIVAVYHIPAKNLLFATEERVELVRQSVVHLPNVEVTAYSGLTVECARRLGAKVLVRGLRAGQDFEREFEMALMNKKLAPDVESIFLMTSLHYQFVSSSLAKEVLQLGGDAFDLFPPPVAEAMTAKFGPARTAEHGNTVPG